MSIKGCGRAAIVGARRLRRAGVAVACIAACATSANPRAATLTYPGIAPCNTTLQACIDGAGNGDTVELAFDAANNESLDISGRSLVLRSKPGNAPQIGYVNIVADAVVAANVTVQGMARIKAIHVFCADADFNLAVRDNSFAGNGSITVHDRSNSSGRCAVDIEGNRLSASAADSDLISVQQSSRALDATIRNNEIVLNNMKRNGGISIHMSRGQDNRVTLDRNRITGSAFDHGISVHASSDDETAPASRLDAVVVNNLVAGQAGNIGTSGGIAIHAEGFNATIAATIANNTIVDGESGIVSAASSDGSAVKLELHNNLVAYNTHQGIGAGAPVEIVSSSNNLSFHNRAGEDGPFPGTFDADPRFVDRASNDYALGAGSPAIDAGSDAALPSTFTLDAAGNARRVGPVDIGALESVLAVAAPLLSPALSALLGGALLTLGIRRQRRVATAQVTPAVRPAPPRVRCAGTRAPWSNRA